MDNPFSLTFGKEPFLTIPRPDPIITIEDSFSSQPAPSQVYIVTGVRGAGKTVVLSNVSRYFAEQEDWIVVELNPESDLLQSLAAKLYSSMKLRSMLSNAEFSVTALGIGVSVSPKPIVADMETEIEEMLKIVHRQNKRVLVLIDEVSNTKSMREFVHSFQIFIRHNHPLFLLMTGLNNNISSLQNEKSLTFLYRAPKAELSLLSISAITDAYAQAFNMSKEKSLDMARLTRGYAYAFQVLGYLVWENKDSSLDEILPQYDLYLEQFVYEKIWEELPEKEKRILLSIADGNTATKAIRETLDIPTNEMSVYRMRLSRRGLVDISTHGQIKLILPRFGKIIQSLAID